jgi:formylglycine-generating enzyme required for sulfatase activity/tRNA A-37 threonylcarbamoyl transferase component Bud32
MFLVSPLIAFALRQVLGDSGDKVAAAVERYFTDRGRALPRALDKANDRAWQALAIALAGDGFFDAVKVFFASGDAKGIRDDVRRFLDGKPFAFEGTPADFRRACLAELKQARKDGLLSADHVDARAVGSQAAELRRFEAPADLIEGACQAVGRVAEGLAPRCPNLATLLRQRPAGGPPLLAASFAYFFRRQVETDAELARGLTFEGLRQLAARQEAAFGEVGRAIEALGGRFDDLLGKALERLGRIKAEVRRLREEVLAHLGRLGMQIGEILPRHSFSIRGEDERRAVKQLLARFRQLPAEEQKKVPDLLNGLGKLQFGACDFAGAERTFHEVARDVGDATAKAEACHNAYRAALEEHKWEEALAAVRRAAELDPRRYAPFPLERYPPRRILGAGAFGTAVLCADAKWEGEKVVVKTLHASDLERGMDAVFQEAKLLRKLTHPAIIKVRDYGYADAENRRPYIVMDYFPGVSLEAFVAEWGVLSPAQLLAVARPIAEGMQAAHARDVLHRDLKPDNVLVRKEGERWLVKVIDFGLALRRQTIETSAARAAGEETILSKSVAGTIRYAPPEQMGRLRDGKGRPVPVGPYSDVFAFGKLCCYALFKTTEPKSRHWDSSPEHLAWKPLLEKCIEEELEHRHAGFEPVLAALQVLDPQTQGRRREAEEAERRRRAEEQRQREEQKRQRAEEQRRAEAEQQRQQDEQQRQTENLRKQEEAARQKRQAEEQARRREKEPQAGKITTIHLGEIQTGGFLGFGKQTVKVTMSFAWCPPGTFLMGSRHSEPERRDDETQHRVTLTRGFWMGVTPVTQAEWQAVMGSNPSYFKGANLPVEWVSWDDCQEFCTKLGEKVGQRFRLPTEAEWEYACRAGTTTPFHFGATISTEQANYNGNYVYAGGREGKTTPVDTFPANPWGLRDVHGNVREWCQDWYGPYPFYGDFKDPQGVQNGDARVVRGGSWFDNPGWCRAASRYRLAPGHRNQFVGCRLVLCLD